jgi:hypothetical protein
VKPGTIISEGQLNSALKTVHKEFIDFGIWNPKVKAYQANVYLCNIPRINSVGFFMHGIGVKEYLLGYEAGNIYIPSIVLDTIFWNNTYTLRDVIRHEYAHAFAHYYRRLIMRSAEFKKVFGGSYLSFNPSGMKADAYITDYAKSMPMEDFAETFMVYVRRKGVLPKKYTNKKLILKWKFIGKIIKAINKSSMKSLDTNFSKVPNKKVILKKNFRMKSFFRKVVSLKSVN